MGGVGAERAAHPSIISYQLSSVVGPGTVTDGADNNDGIIDEVDADAAFGEIGRLFPRGFGNAEFRAKARAAYDALLARGCRPADVLARLRGSERREWPLQDLEDQGLFADLFREDPAKVMDWAARYGTTSASPAAREIAAIRARDPLDRDPRPESVEKIVRVYRDNEPELQRAYALAHASGNTDNR